MRTLTGSLELSQVTAVHCSGAEVAEISPVSLSDLGASLSF